MTAQAAAIRRRRAEDDAEIARREREWNRDSFRKAWPELKEEKKGEGHGEGAGLRCDHAMV